MAVLDLDDWQLVLILGGCGCFVLGLVLCYICAVMQRLSKELPSKLEDTYRSKAAVRGIRPALRARPARLPRRLYRGCRAGVWRACACACALVPKLGPAWQFLSQSAAPIRWASGRRWACWHTLDAPVNCRAERLRAR